jgi:endonuclease YncB( thermonuclease family)
MRTNGHRMIVLMGIWLCGLMGSPALGVVHPEPDPLAALPPTIKIPEPKDLIAAKVIRIFDADTILVQIGDVKRRYQLLGVHAPQFNPKDRTPKPFSVESRRFIEQLLLGESVYIQHDSYGVRDRQNRRAAYVFRAPDMLFVNLELVRQGYAKHDPKLGSLYNDSFHHYESKAKVLFRGIWNPNTPAIDWTQQQLPVADPDLPSVTRSPTKSSATKGPKSPETNPPASPAERPDGLVPIYITKSGSKYHKKDCPHLTDSQRPTTREKVKATHKPCKTCKPDG